MSEDQDKPGDAQTEGEPQGPIGGERLAQARREQQISVLEVAKELHLDEPKVRALERNDFDVLGAPVFAKGHLRKYAQLVDVDADDVFADYYRMTRSTDMPPIFIGRSKARRELTPGPWIAVLAAILLVAAAYWWLASRGTVAPAEPPPQAQPQQAEPTVGPDAAAEDAADEEVVDDDVVDNDVADGDIDAVVDDTVVLAAALPGVAPAAAEPVPEAAEPPAEGQIRLSLTFSADCWTEISDADGRRLFFNMGRGGRSVELSGKAPLSALFGNADGVSLRVNGNDYAIPASSRSNRTARLTIINP